MATYNAAAVSNTAIAFKKPITLQQGRALRDNPDAAFEGSSGAPYTQAQWHPYNGVYWGTGSFGVIYNVATDGAVSSVVTPDFEDGYEYLLLFDEIGSSLAPDLTIELYGETSASYGTAMPVLSATGLAEFTGAIAINRPRFSRAKCVVSGHYSNGAATGAGATFVYADRRGTAQKRLRARIAVSTGTINAGRIRMYRRRDPLSV